MHINININIYSCSIILKEKMALILENEISIKNMKKFHLRLTLLVSVWCSLLPCNIIVKSTDV